MTRWLPRIGLVAAYLWLVWLVYFFSRPEVLLSLGILEPHP